MIPLMVRLKRSTILAFRSENVVKNLILYILRNSCTWKFLFVCSNYLVSAPLISLPCFDFRGKSQAYLDSTSIIDKMNL